MQERTSRDSELPVLLTPQNTGGHQKKLETSEDRSADSATLNETPRDDKVTETILKTPIAMTMSQAD